MPALIQGLWPARLDALIDQAWSVPQTELRGTRSVPRIPHGLRGTGGSLKEKWSTVARIGENGCPKGQNDRDSLQRPPQPYQSKPRELKEG